MITEIPMDTPLQRRVLKPPFVRIETDYDVTTPPCWFATAYNYSTQKYHVHPVEAPTVSQFKNAVFPYTVYAANMAHNSSSYAWKYGINSTYAYQRSNTEIGFSFSNGSRYSNRRPVAWSVNQPTFNFAGGHVTVHEIVPGSPNDAPVFTGNTKTISLPAMTFHAGQQIYDGNTPGIEKWIRFDSFFQFYVMHGEQTGQYSYVYSINRPSVLNPTGALQFTSTGFRVPCDLGVVEYDMTKVTGYYSSTDTLLTTLDEEKCLHRIEKGIIPARFYFTDLQAVQTDGIVTYSSFPYEGSSMRTTYGDTNPQLFSSFQRPNLRRGYKKTYPVEIVWNEGNQDLMFVNNQFTNAAYYREPIPDTPITLPTIVKEGSITISVP